MKTKNVAPWIAIGFTLACIPLTAFSGEEGSYFLDPEDVLSTLISCDAYRDLDAEAQQELADRIAALSEHEKNSFFGMLFSSKTLFGGNSKKERLTRKTNREYYIPLAAYHGDPVAQMICDYGIAQGWSGWSYDSEPIKPD